MNENIQQKSIQNIITKPNNDKNEWGKILSAAKKQLEYNEKELTNCKKEFKEWIEKTLGKKIKNRNLATFAIFLANAYYSLVLINKSFYEIMKIRKISDKRINEFLDFIDDDLEKLMIQKYIAIGLTIKSKNLQLGFYENLTKAAERDKLKFFAAIDSSDYIETIRPIRIEYTGTVRSLQGRRGYIIPYHWINIRYKEYEGFPVLLDEELPPEFKIKIKLKGIPENFQKQFCLIPVTDSMIIINEPKIAKV